jgi:DNA polymerase-3 subunit delta'
MSEISALPWPPALAGTPAIAVIERAIGRQRLAHSLLLHGDDLDTLVAVAQAIADRLLNPGGSGRRPFSANGHPDCFTLGPAGKSRQITADATRELIADVQKSPAVAAYKVAILVEADRMNAAAANIFLKTLEEPPARTVILLLTTHPYALLPTIRSRCLHFKFSAPGGNLSAPLSGEARAKTGAPPGEATEDSPATGGSSAWPAWLEDYRAWLGRLGEGPADKRTVADHLLSVYGLIARFGAILDRQTAEAWEQQKGSLSPDLEKEQQVAIETGIANGRRARLFKEIEIATQDFARARLRAGEDSARRVFAAAVEKLERDVGLLRVNLNAPAALEDFLLSSLRLWAKR